MINIDSVFTYLIRIMGNGNKSREMGGEKRALRRGKAVMYETQHLGYGSKRRFNG